MEEYEKQHANVESLAMTQGSHKQKDHIWLFAQRMCLHCGKRCTTMPPDAFHLLPSTIFATNSINSLLACGICLHRRYLNNTDTVFLSMQLCYTHSPAC